MSEAWARMSGDALKIDRLEAELAAARREIAKLREALGQITALTLGGSGTQMREIARAALAASPAAEEPQP